MNYLDTLKKERSIDRVIFLAGMVLAFIGFLVPTVFVKQITVPPVDNTVEVISEDAAEDTEAIAEESEETSEDSEAVTEIAETESEDEYYYDEDADFTPVYVVKEEIRDFIRDRNGKDIYKKIIKIKDSNDTIIYNNLKISEYDTPEKIGVPYKDVAKILSEKKKGSENEYFYEGLVSDENGNKVAIAEVLKSENKDKIAWFDVTYDNIFEEEVEVPATANEDATKKTIQAKVGIIPTTEEIVSYSYVTEEMINHAKAMADSGALDSHFANIKLEDAKTVYANIFGITGILNKTPTDNSQSFDLKNGDHIWCSGIFNVNPYSYNATFFVIMWLCSIAGIVLFFATKTIIGDIIAILLGLGFAIASVIAVPATLHCAPITGYMAVGGYMVIIGWVIAIAGSVLGAAHIKHPEIVKDI